MARVGATGPLVSYTDLQQIPDEGRRYELYDGEVWVVPSPLPLHQVVLDRFGDRLKAYRQAAGGLVFFSPLDVVFSEFSTAQPDIFFFTLDRAHLIDLRQVIRVAPDLAAEVLSPSTTSIDRGRKMKLYAQHGVREYWLIDPDLKRIEVCGLRDGMYAVVHVSTGAAAAVSGILPGFSVTADSLF